jgi:hypothetical protein
LLKRIIEPLVDSFNLSSPPSLFNTQVSSKNICSSDGWLDLIEAITYSCINYALLFMPVAYFYNNYTEFAWYQNYLWQMDG